MCGGGVGRAMPKVEVSSRSQSHTTQEEADDQINDDAGVTGTLAAGDYVRAAVT